MEEKKIRTSVLIAALAIAGFLVWYFGVPGPVVVASAQATSVPRTSDAQAQLATVKQYCVTCHNDRVKAGGQSFDGITADTIGQRADIFEKAVRKLRGRVMPPPGSRQPDGAAADSLVAWLEDSLDRAAAAGP
jgi:mono/diheme cytochrome c family protein